MNKKIILAICVIIMFIMPILSVEDIFIWIISIFFISKSIKVFKNKNSLKPVIINTTICFLLIVLYNVIARYIEDILIKMWV